MRLLSPPWVGNPTKHKDQFQEGKEELKMEMCVAGFPLHRKEKGPSRCVISLRGRLCLLAMLPSGGTWSPSGALFSAI